MNAKKCDRCGKYYDLYEMEIPERYKDRTNGKMNFVALHGKDIERCDGMPTGSSRPIDLCPDCMDGLLGYLSGQTPEEAVISICIDGIAIRKVIKDSGKDKSCPPYILLSPCSPIFIFR